MNTIDYQRLSRNYTEMPLKKGKSSRWGSVLGEIPPYHDIYYLYIECLLSIKELAEFFNRKRDSAFIWLKHHNIKKTNDQSVDSVKRKKKIIYGDENYNNMEKNKATKFSRYGNENYCNIELQKKNFSLKSREEIQQIVAKRKLTNLKKYGYEHLMQNPEFKKKIFKTYGARRSKPELQLEQWFNKNNIKIESQFVLQYHNKIRIYDFYLPAFNLLIEYDGDFFHRLKIQQENDAFKNKIAKEQGYRLARIKGKAMIDTCWELQNIGEV